VLNKLVSMIKIEEEQEKRKTNKLTTTLRENVEFCDTIFVPYFLEL
jgi:hypothetical protein